MNPRDVSELNPKTRIDNALPVLQPGEHVLFTIKRHPMGILRVYALCLLITLLIGGLAFVLAPGGDEAQSIGIGTLALVIVGAIASIFALVITKIYWGNTWTLTTDSLTQIDQIGIFKRRSSQLSLENIEDVTSEQTGLLPRLFNYGRVRVQTAGEHGKFIFQFCPNPNYYATQILAAGERFEQHNREEAGYHQPVPPVEPPIVQPQLAQPLMPPQSAAAVPQQQPAPPTPSQKIDSYEVPDGSPDSA